MAEQVRFEPAGRDAAGEPFRPCRRMIVGPWCNQPEEYEGYNGFVGWAGLTILRSGRWLCTFSSGYWHASMPLTEEVLADEKCRKLFEYYQTLGCPYIRAPRGGRGHIMHSDDRGRTWSKPETLIDTELDDRHPTIIELDDGAWLCMFFQYRLPQFGQACWIRSQDQGKTWTAPVTPPGGQPGGFGAGPTIQLRDGSVVWVAEGIHDDVAYPQIGVYRSTDRGRSFELASVLRADHELNEPSVVEMPSGRLAVITRRQGDLWFSDDGGRTWTPPQTFGVELFDPHLLMLPNGVLACFHGSYPNGGIRVILSGDEGRTWHGPTETFGYGVDLSVYGYCHPVLLDDGTVLLVYLHSGGHHTADARTEALWLLRVAVSDTADGIEILPAPGSPAERKASLSHLESQRTEGGDPALGEL